MGVDMNSFHQIRNIMLNHNVSREFIENALHLGKTRDDVWELLVLFASADTDERDNILADIQHVVGVI